MFDPLKYQAHPLCDASMQSFYKVIICTICVPDRSVWVSDSQQPFVEHPGQTPAVLYLKVKQPLLIPCRVTHPNVTTTLVKVSAKKKKKELDNNSSCSGM